jgi:hypothetical protein
LASRWNTFRANTGRNADEGEQDQPTQGPGVPHGAQPRLQALEDALRRRDRAAPARQQQEREDRGQERQGVQAEAGGGAELVEGDAGQHRAHDAREIELDRVERHGVRQVLAIHQRRHQSLISRTAEGLREPDDERQAQNHPDLHGVGEQKDREKGGAAHLHVLRAEQDTAAVHTIGQDPAEEGKHEKRRVAQKCVEAQQEGRSRHREDQPVLRHLLHPRPDTRGEGAHPHQAEIAVREGLERLEQRRVAYAGILRPGRLFEIFSRADRSGSPRTPGPLRLACS